METQLIWREIRILPPGIVLPSGCNQGKVLKVDVGK